MWAAVPVLVRMHGLGFRRFSDRFLLFSGESHVLEARVTGRSTSQNNQCNTYRAGLKSTIVEASGIRFL